MAGLNLRVAHFGQYPDFVIGVVEWLGAFERRFREIGALLKTRRACLKRVALNPSLSDAFPFLPRNRHRQLRGAHVALFADRMKAFWSSPL